MASTDLGYGFFDIGRNAEITEEYSGKHWGCYQCSRPDYNMVRDTFEGPQRLSLRCPMKRNAPYANSFRCVHFVQDPQLRELRGGTITPPAVPG